MKNLALSLFALVIVTVILASCNYQGGETGAKLTLTDSLIKKDSTINANKKLVATFYQEFFGDKNISALDKYLVEGYIQHNPALPDGREPLRQGATLWFRGAPKTQIDIQHISADGDLVYIHLKNKMGDKTSSVIDIFRIAGGKIVEHWDVIQDVPAKSANPHPMF
jgi:predicted SnoaL-like aldol condensation-catalyzing enzyme